MDVGHIEWEHLLLNQYTAGVAGALVGAAKSFPGASWGDRFLNAFTGSTASIFIGGALVDYLHLDSPRVSMGVAWMVGVGGVLMCNTLLESLRGSAIALENLPVIGHWFRSAPPPGGNAQ